MEGPADPTLNALSQAAVEAVGAVTRAQGLADRVDEVFAAAEQLLTAAGLAHLTAPPSAPTAIGNVDGPPYLVVAAAYATALIAAAELREVIGQLSGETAVAAMALERSNAIAAGAGLEGDLAPEGNPFRAAQIKGAMATVDEISFEQSRGNHARAWALAVEMRTTFRWLVDILEHSESGVAVYSRLLDELTGRSEGRWHSSVRWIDSIRTALKYVTP